MHICKAIVVGLGVVAASVSAQVHAKTISAEASAQVYLSNDNWTINKDSMYLTNAKNCTVKVQYEHDGNYKTIGTCTHKGNDGDLRGDFYYDFGAKVLYRDATPKGFSLAAKSVKCHYQLQQMPPPASSYYYYVTCDLKDSNATITPFGGACSKAASVKVTAGQDGVMLTPTCNDE